ncbi:MAG: diguanylate cyclase [Tahibacter sp.]
MRTGIGLLLGLLWLNAAGAAHAAMPPTVELRAEQTSVALASGTSYLVDRDASADAKTMFARGDAGDFLPLPGGSATFGFVDGAYWFHISIDNLDHVQTRWLLVLEYALLDNVDVYLRYAAGPIEHRQSGDMRPFRDRAVSYRHPNFWVDLAKGQHVDVLVRTVSKSSMQVPLTLYTPTAFIERGRDAQLGMGIYYGILFGLFFYNFILFLSMRDRSHLFYSTHVAGFGLVLFCLNGLAFEYLWPDSPWLANAAIPMSMSMAMLFMQLFARDFLELPRRMPYGDRVVLALIAFHAIMLALSPFLDYRIAVKIGTAAVFPGVAAIIGCAVVAARRGFRPALLFLLAWATLLAGTMIYAMVSFGMLPKNFFTEYGMQIGSAAEMILLSFALAYRWASLRGENERIARDATEQLEHRVQERTLELSTALDQLGVAHARLREYSSRDGLTGVYNRRHFDTVFAPSMATCVAAAKPYSLLVADLDHFKHVNDDYGHLVGDDCLRTIAAVLVEAAGEGSIVARFGGEEFIVLMPGADQLDARRIGESIRQRVSAQSISADDGKRVRLTVSVGIATTSNAADVQPETLLRRADEAMYEAKRAGRNRVVQQMVAA